MQAAKDVGADEPSIREKPRWQVMQELHSTELRLGAEKQMLRPREEEALPLVGPVTQGDGRIGVGRRATRKCGSYLLVEALESRTRLNGSLAIKMASV